MNNYNKISTLFLLHTSIAFSLHAGGYIGLSAPVTYDNYEIESLDYKSNVYYYGREKNSATGVGVELFGGYGFTDSFSGEVSVKFATVSQISANLKYGYEFFENGIHPFILLGIIKPKYNFYEVDEKAIPYTGSNIENSFETTFPLRIGVGSSYVMDESYVLRAGLNYILPYDYAPKNSGVNLHVNYAIELYVGVSYDFFGTSSFAYYTQQEEETVQERWADEEIGY